MDSIIYDLWLALKVKNNTSFACELLARLGSAERIYNMQATDEVYGLLEDKDISDAEMEYKRCVDDKIFVIPYTDKLYPKELKEADNPPVVLYAKGNISLLEKPLITVAGSKRCSSEGKQNTARFIKSMSNSGIVPVCGFSQGIEAEVCKSVQEAIAFLACGINETYPAKHYALKRSMIKEGGLVLSALPLDSKALPQNIVLRNDLIAAVSLSCFIPEAREGSRTGMIFNNCEKYQKPCFVIPGSITSSYCGGSNGFIKNGGILVTEPADIIKFYIPFGAVDEEQYVEDKNVSDVIVPDSFDDGESAVIKALSGNKLSYDDLVLKSNLPVSQAASVITMLEMSGVIINEGGIFRVNNERM